MSKLSVDVVAPNGVAYTQPTGLFINNEFVEAAKGETIDSIDPASVETPKIPYWGLVSQLSIQLLTIKQNGGDYRDRASRR